MLDIGLDFDGTICDLHDNNPMYPSLGKPVPLAIDYIKQFQEEKANLFLWTARSELMNGSDHLSIAIKYLNDHGIILQGVNNNPLQTWTVSPKLHVDVLIDDTAFGCPLIHHEGFTRPSVNWAIVGPSVLKMLHLAKAKQPYRIIQP